MERSLRHVIQRNISREYHATTAAEATAWLAELSGSVVRAEGQLQAKAKEAEALEAELAERKGELEQVEEELKQLGAAAPEEVKAARQQREELAAKMAELEGKLSDAWELAIPVGLLGKFGQELYRDLLEEEKRREWESSKAGAGAQAAAAPGSGLCRGRPAVCAAARNQGLLQRAPGPGSSRAFCSARPQG